MPHTINIDGISESLFILQNLVHASGPFCRSHGISWSNDPAGEFDWDYYFGWLKSISCDHLIQVCTRLRMLQDILVANDEEIDFRALDTESRKGLTIGRFEGSKKVLSLRDAWNKVIHATDTTLDWKHEEAFQYWTGGVWLTGKWNGSEWKVLLDIVPFATASVRLVRELELSVDWHHLYKHDG